MTSSLFRQYYKYLITFLGGFYCLWYLIPSSLLPDQIIPLILLAFFIGLLGISPLPVNDLSQAVVLGGSLTYGSPLTAAAVFLGVLLSGFYQRLNPWRKTQDGIRADSFPSYTFFQIGLLLVPMALASETLNWQPNTLYDLSWFDISFRKAITFTILFIIARTIIRTAGSIWHKSLYQDPIRHSMPIIIGLELVVLPIVYIAALLFSYNEIAAIGVLGAFCIVLSFTLNLTAGWPWRFKTPS